MAPEGDSKRTDQEAERARRRTRRRKRTLLNLGKPLRQLDQFFNQSEDAIALGYRVLEKTVIEIQQGYKEAQDFNKLQDKWLQEGGPAPVIPWDQLVSRAQNLQNLALDAMIEGADIFADSARSATDSVADAAKAWKQSRQESAGQQLAGPVFTDPIRVDVRQGEKLDAIKMDIRHPGLTRLRIKAEMQPEPQLLDPKNHRLPTLAVSHVSFEPKDKGDDATSTLTIELAPVSSTATVGRYEGVVRAKNFQLMIARLHVEVTAAASVGGSSGGAVYPSGVA
jgi:hypothetical protein